MPRWAKNRDAAAGQDAIHAGGQEYLPALSSHKDSTVGAGAQYEAYKARALYYNMVKRTLLGLSGAATLREPKVEKAKFEDIAKKIAKLAPTVISEQLLLSRVAFSVAQGLTGEADVTLWFAENIVNWRWGRNDDDTENILTMAVLETTEDTVDASSPFKSVSRRIRHGWYLKDNECWYEKWSTKEDEEDWANDRPAELVILSGGRKLDHIPVKILGGLEEDPLEVEEPLLSDVVDVNLSHYHNSADLENGRHWCATPTPWASGFPTIDPKTEQPIEFVVGGQSAWITEQQGATCGYLEFSGSGLGHIAEGMKEKQAMAAVLGARLLEEQKPSVEASETIKTRHTGEKSVLSRVARTTSHGLTWSLQEVTSFQNPAYETGSETEDLITLQTDFLDKVMSPAQLSALVQALVQNTISYQTFFEMLQNADIISANTTVDEEIARINAGRPGPAIADPFAGDGSQDGNFPPNEDPQDPQDQQTENPADAIADTKKKPNPFQKKAAP